MEQKPVGADTNDADLLKLIGKNEHLNRENRKLWAMVKEATTGDARTDRIIEAIEDNVAAREPVAFKPYARRRARIATSAAILCLSDFHHGETVDPEDTGNLFQYNPEISALRYDECIDRGIEIARFHKVGNFVTAHLGDMVSGEIHEDLIRSNELELVAQTIDFAEMAAGRVQKVSEYFTNTLVSVSGNHPRIQKRPHFRHKQTENMDYMVAKYMQALLQNQKNLKFEIPKSYWAVIAAGGRKFYLMHGDTNYQQKAQSISFYAIDKEGKKKVVNAAYGMGVEFDDIIAGHQHTQGAIPIGMGMWYQNGSGKGPDVFSDAGTRPMDEAEQRMLIVENGKVLADYNIPLQHIGAPLKAFDAHDQLYAG